MFLIETLLLLGISKLYILKWWVNHLPSYNAPLPWMISMSVNFFALNCLMKTILQNLILLHKQQLILTIFSQLSNIWMVLIQSLSTLTKPWKMWKTNSFQILHPMISSHCLVSQPHAHLDSIKTSYMTTTNLSLLPAMQQIKTGTASGPFAYSLEVFPSFALTPSQCSGPDKEIMYPNLPLACSFINILHNAKLLDDVLPAFNASHFLALHKKNHSHWNQPQKNCVLLSLMLSLLILLPFWLLINMASLSQKACSSLQWLFGILCMTCC